MMAIGDDLTDEYIFEELPDSAFKIKVGLGMTKADFYMKDHTDVLQLLKELISSPEK